MRNQEEERRNREGERTDRREAAASSSVRRIASSGSIAGCRVMGRCGGCMFSTDASSLIDTIGRRS